MNKLNLILRNFVIFTFSIFFLFIAGSDLIAQQNQKIKISNDVELIQIKDSIYMHTSITHSNEFGTFASNGLLLIKNGKALIVDTPTDDELTAQIYNYLADSMNVKIEKFIAGHSHIDCMGGIGFLHQKGVHSIALDLTQKICTEKKLPLAKQSFTDSLNFDFYGEKVICRYFGAGHTVDNIVVYLPESKVLFGGCLIKTLRANNMGNLADASVKEWDKTVEKIQKAYPEIEYIIPGHGDFGNVKLLEHTIELVKGYKSKK